MLLLECESAIVSVMGDDQANSKSTTSDKHENQLEWLHQQARKSFRMAS
jgi:hypothetical protein